MYGEYTSSVEFWGIMNHIIASNFQSFFDAPVDGSDASDIWLTWKHGKIELPNYSLDIQSHLQRRLRGFKENTSSLGMRVLDV